jgi:hypothetical protein
MTANITGNDRMFSAIALSPDVTVTTLGMNCEGLVLAGVTVSTISASIASTQARFEDSPILIGVVGPLRIGVVPEAPAKVIISPTDAHGAV